MSPLSRLDPQWGFPPCERGQKKMHHLERSIDL